MEWPAKIKDYEPLILKWQKEYKEFLKIDYLIQYAGFKVYALSISDKRYPLEKKKKHLFMVPHAHEPAGTVASIDFINQILTGKDLDGNICNLNREEILSKCLLTFIPDANPGGRMRSPVEFWDGKKYSKQDFLKFMRGIDMQTGKMWKRIDKWSIKEENPKTIGIVYERINKYEYVEPNRSKSSSLLRLVKLLCQKYDYNQLISLHQTEFEDSPYNLQAILPIIQEDLPEKIKGYNKKWAKEIIKRWQEIGGNPVPQAEPLGYTGKQREYFIHCWSKIYQKIPTIIVEIQNNNLRTPPHKQLFFMEEAIRLSVERLLK